MIPTSFLFPGQGVMPLCGCSRIHSIHYLTGPFRRCIHLDLYSNHCLPWWPCRKESWMKIEALPATALIFQDHCEEDVTTIPLHKCLTGDSIFVQYLFLYRV